MGTRPKWEQGLSGNWAEVGTGPKWEQGLSGNRAEVSPATERVSLLAAMPAHAVACAVTEASGSGLSFAATVETTAATPRSVHNKLNPPKGVLWLQGK